MGWGRRPDGRAEGRGPADGDAGVARYDAEILMRPAEGWSLAFVLGSEAEHPAGGGRSAGSMAWAGLGNTYLSIDRVRDRAGCW